ncbi:MAG: DUF4249 domain-containing protein [Candidatus Saccharibacteria bacterium]
MVKSLTYLIGTLLILLGFSSCEKVIPIDLADTKEAIVIEAQVTNTSMPFTVKISKTAPYFGSASNKPVTGAKVSIKSEKGKLKYFTEVAPGLYTYAKTPAFPNILYILTVEYDGVTYTAQSFMNESVSISDISLSYFDGLGLLESGYRITTFIRDPADVENYYRIKYFVNGKASTSQSGISLYSDLLFNGKGIGLGQRSLVFKKTDTVTVELQSIDKAAYDYFSTLESISGLDLMQTVSPANPISNFNNGALGYFSAYTLDRKTIVIKDYIDN